LLSRPSPVRQAPIVGPAVPGLDAAIKILVALLLLLGFFVFVLPLTTPVPGSSAGDDRLATSLARIAKAPQIQRENRRRLAAAPVATAAAAPDAASLQEQARRLSQLVLAVENADSPGVARALGELRQAASARNAASANLLIAQAMREQSQGWIALGDGDRDAALAHFDRALWADPEYADTWLGRALATRDGSEASAMATIALLMYPDAGGTSTRVNSRLWSAAHYDLMRHHELEILLEIAAGRAEALRRILPPGTVRATGRIVWRPK
jgi:tetratricopeptide (TPR) repeat protein